MPDMQYTTPKIEDYGTLTDLTAACFGSGSQDELGKDWGIDARTNPLGGNQGFCVPGP